MSLHINAQEGDIAETVLMPGDPLRAKIMAEKFLIEPKCYNQIRGMFGFTGKYKGKSVSIQGSGMGMPSFAIYANELINDYGVKKIIRVGSCGSFNSEVKLQDIVIAMSASTDSAMNSQVFQGATFAPTANFDLLIRAFEVAQNAKIKIHVGNILSTDIFYSNKENYWNVWKEHNVLAVEMETAALYTLAAYKQIKALSILTVSDSFITDEHCSSEERESNFNQMIQIALEIA